MEKIPMFLDVLFWFNLEIQDINRNEIHYQV